MQLEEIFSQFNFDEETLELIKTCFEPVEFEPGDLIVKKGQSSDSFFCLARGEVAILDGNTTGPEKTIDLGTPGYFFGEIGILHNIARTASVKALTPVQVFYTKADNFQKLLNKSKSFAEFIKQLSITRLLKNCLLYTSDAADDEYNV